MDNYLNIGFDVYNEDKKVGHIILRGNEVVENISYFDVDSEPYPFMINPFIRMTDGYAVRTFLETRVVPPNRVDLDYILKDMGLDEYNIYKILEITHGVKADDTWWIRFDHMPDDGLRWKDLNLRDDSNRSREYYG